MKICILAEGCYPFIAGGVSIWLQNLILAFPQHEFSIVAIGAESSQKGQYKFKIPKNVECVKEIFFDEIHALRGRWGGRFSLTDAETELIRNLLNGGVFDTDVLFRLIDENRIDNVISFLLSRSFFDIVSEVCEKDFPGAPFSDFYWNARSMVLPLFFLMNKKLLPEADLYHSVSAGYAGALGAIASYWYEKPFIMTEHGIYTREREEEVIISRWVSPEFKDLWIRYFYSMSKIAYDSADRVITLFERNRRIQLFLGCESEKAIVIPNGVDTAKFAAVPPADMSLKPTIGAIVRVVPIKDIKTLIYAFAIVKARIPDSRLLIMGGMDENPEYCEECLAIVKDLKLTDIRFMGSVNIAEALKEVHVVTLTSISEAQPLALLEAMAAGRACVATDVGCCRELLEDSDGLGVAGYITPIMHPEKIAQALINILSLPDKGVRMGQAGQERVRAYYNNKRWLQDYKELYDSFDQQAGKSCTEEGEQIIWQELALR